MTDVSINVLFPQEARELFKNPDVAKADTLDVSHSKKLGLELSEIGNYFKRRIQIFMLSKGQVYFRKDQTINLQFRIPKYINQYHLLPFKKITFSLLSVFRELKMNVTLTIMTMDDLMCSFLAINKARQTIEVQSICVALHLVNELLFATCCS